MLESEPMNPDIIARFENQRAPRYTSYPTAPHFTDRIADADYRKLLAELPADDGISLYLHVPFCRSMCWYCGCHTKIVGKDGPVHDYLQDLSREVRMVAAALPRRMKVRHIHWGGGTPTIATPAAFGELMDQLRDSFTVLPDAEVAVEVDPRGINDAMIETLGSTGVNRVSLGVQSFDPAVQIAINRVQSFEQTAHVCDQLRGMGIGSINFDLIYGLPHQTVASCEDTIKRALQLQPDQLSVFGYAHVPWLKKHQRMIDPNALPKPSQRLALFTAMSEALAKAGYRRIGLDHFARPGDRLEHCLREGRLHRNFQGYTGDQCSTLLGFGASAIGTLPKAYVQNIAPIGDYRRRIEAGSLATERGRYLSADDRLRRDVIERIMCDFRVDLGAVAAGHGADTGRFADELIELGDLQRDGVVDIQGSVLSIDEAYWPLTRTIASVFDTYLRPDEVRHTAAI